MTDNQKKALKDTEDAVMLRMKDPWTGKLNDLVLYKQMNAEGIRVANIDQLIRKELENYK